MPLGTLLTALYGIPALAGAERAGKSTGLVTTGRVTAATPAAFGSHVTERYADQSEIARQYLEESTPEVILGGGENRWFPPGTEGAWPDRQPKDPTEEANGTAGNLVDRAEQLDYQYVSDADGLAGADGDMLLGLFATEEMFEYDDGLEAIYEPEVPLPVMADKALDVLSQNPEGFFLVLEEEGIDGMGHRGNAELMLEAGRDLDETVALARDFAAEHGNTLIVVVGDHETGGLTIESAHGAIEAGEEDGSENGEEEWAESDEGDWSESGEGSENGPFAVAGTDLAVKAEWTTPGHTAAATPASAEGPGAHRMMDVRDHTDIHDLVLEAMALGD